MKFIGVVPVGPKWAVKHAGGFLGYAASKAEAVQAGHHLVQWMMARGQSARLVEEPCPSFVSPG